MITFPPQTQPINAKFHEGEPILYINWSFSGLPFLCRWLTPRRVFVQLWYFVTSRHFPQKQHKKYSITKLMTAQIFYKTTTGELFPIALPWMITHQRWWLLVFVYKTLLFDCTFQQSHHPIIVTLNYREKICGRCF